MEFDDIIYGWSSFSLHVWIKKGGAMSKLQRLHGIFLPLLLFCILPVNEHHLHPVVAPLRVWSSFYSTMVAVSYLAPVSPTATEKVWAVTRPLLAAAWHNVPINIHPDSVRTSQLHLRLLMYSRVVSADGWIITHWSSCVSELTSEVLDMTADSEYASQWVRVFAVWAKVWIWISLTLIWKFAKCPKLSSVFLMLTFLPVLLMCSQKNLHMSRGFTVC